MSLLFVTYDTNIEEGLLVRWIIGCTVVFILAAGLILLRAPTTDPIANDFVECNSIANPTVRSVEAVFPVAGNLTLQKTFCRRYQGPDPIYWLILNGDLVGNLEGCSPLVDLRNAAPDDLALLFPQHSINGFAGWCGVYRHDGKRTGITLIPVPDTFDTVVAIVAFPF